MYANIVSKIKQHPKLLKYLIYFTKYAHMPIVLAYAVGIAYTLVIKPSFILKYIFVPATLLLIVELIRHLFYIPRPFLKEHFEPLVEHETSSSFPSKHTASAFMISLTIYQLMPAIGIILGVLSILIAISRVLCGIHRFSDIIFGFLLSLILSTIYYLGNLI